MAAHVIDKKWFRTKLEDADKSQADLARHVGLGTSQISRILGGTRKMQLEEAHKIASFLGVAVNEVLARAGASTDLDGQPTRILLTAAINSRGNIKKLDSPGILPHKIIERAHAATHGHNQKVLAAVIQASSGPLALFDDAVFLFRHTDSVEKDAIGALSVCRTDKGQMLAKVERSRKTGEAYIRCVNADDSGEVTLLTATPVLAIIP